jgi:hypothetical protein
MDHIAAVTARIGGGHIDFIERPVPLPAVDRRSLNT